MTSDKEEPIPNTVKTTILKGSQAVSYWGIYNCQEWEYIPTTQRTGLGCQMWKLSRHCLYQSGYTRETIEESIATNLVRRS